MLAKPPDPLSGIAILPGGRSARKRGGRLPEVGLGLWVLLLATLPLVLSNVLPEGSLLHEHRQEHGHMLIEGFCGFVAMILSLMLFAVNWRRFSLSLLLFALAFLSMGIFDILHALADPDRDMGRFVLYHTLSTFLGAGFIVAGIVAKLVRDRKYLLTRDNLLAVANTTSFIIAIALIYRAYLPTLFPAGPAYLQFPSHLLWVHYLASLFYGISAVAFFRYFQLNRQVMYLVLASLMLLFSQSAYLFSFSNIWNSVWWLWHGVKVVFYLGLMVTLFINYLLALASLEASGRVLVRSNRKLQRSQQAAERFNKELRIRNLMFHDTLSALDLDHALEAVSKAVRQLAGFSASELILDIPADQVGEFQRRAPRLATRLPVLARGTGLHCRGGGCAPWPAGQQELVTCESLQSGEPAHICLSLAVTGRHIGHLRLRADAGADITRGQAHMRGLAVEAGTVIHSALIYQEWIEANEFRMALLRVSNLLSSTLELDVLLESVCKESAALLESDGALVWLPESGEDAFTLGAKWFDQDTQAPALAEVESWCRDGAVCASLLRSFHGAARSRSIFWQDDPEFADQARPDGCPWEAIALFPLHDEGSLIGVMVLMRRDPVRFSAATLAKGELLAGQVRIAIKNARGYERLAEINQQLMLAEADKIRSERLAVLGQMSASVAHEVRNPLSAIANCLSVLKSGSVMDDRGRTALGIIEDEVERLNTLTSNFLTFGKPQARIRKPVALERVLHKVALALERHITQEGLPIQLELDLPGTCTQFEFDADGLETVLWNLLLNATQAIHGSGMVYLALRQARDHFTLVVADSGKGISAEDRERIFDPFFTRRSHGAGLGLAIVHRLVSEWGGRIRLSSRPGEGAAFCVRVPLPAGAAIPLSEAA